MQSISSVYSIITLRLQLRLARCWLVLFLLSIVLVFEVQIFSYDSSQLCLAGNLDTLVVYEKKKQMQQFPIIAAYKQCTPLSC